MVLKIISRTEWGAAPAKWEKLRQEAARFVFCGYTDTPSCHDDDSCMREVLSLQTLHISSRRISDIRFNFLLGDDGKVYEGRGWKEEPALPRDYAAYNPVSIYIVYLADTKKIRHGEYEVCQDLIEQGVFNVNIRDNFKLIYL